MVYGPKRPFLFGYGSRDTRRIDFPRVDGLSTDPRVLGHHTLTELEEQKLLEILRKYKEAIAWSIEDLKGISPSICMHKILLEDNSKNSIEYQRRLNPVMKEVVKKEVLKWMNASFIYSILDSP